MDTAEWTKVFAVNLNGPFFLSRAIARHMIDQGVHGSIVNISSGAGSSARTGGSHYCGSKAAINMFTKVLAIELGPHQIRVNAVAPGLILDEVMSLPVPEGANEYVGTLLKGIPLGSHRHAGRYRSRGEVCLLGRCILANWRDHRGERRLAGRSHAPATEFAQAAEVILTRRARRRAAGARAWSESRDTGPSEPLMSESRCCGARLAS